MLNFSAMLGAPSKTIEELRAEMRRMREEAVAQRTASYAAPWGSPARKWREQAAKDADRQADRLRRQVEQREEKGRVASAGVTTRKGPANYRGTPTEEVIHGGRVVGRLEPVEYRSPVVPPGSMIAVGYRIVRGWTAEAVREDGRRVSVCSTALPCKSKQVAIRKILEALGIG